MSMDLVADALRRNLELMKMTLSDFSDAEMMTRPCPGANHATWQLGHLTVAEGGLLNMVGEGLVQGPPAEFAAKFSKETASKDDAGFFPKKAAVLEQFNKINAAVAAWAKTLKPEDLAKPTKGRMVDFAPTTGHVIALLSNHNMMHIGQFQVIRRKLGKPILF